MRLRNLYEVQIQPGERRGFSLRLKKVENLQLKVAEMQQAISNLKLTNVPDVIKKQMQDLIDTANMEKEKLYSELSVVQKPIPGIEDIPGNVLKFFKGLDRNCSIIMNAYRQTDELLYRGIKSDEEILYGKPFDVRRAKDSNQELSNILNGALASQGFDARRDNTSFTSGNSGQASNYGTVYIFIPRDGFTFHYSKKIKDLVLGTDKLHMLVDNDLTEILQKAVYDNWDSVKKYFTHRSQFEKMFFDSYYQSDLAGLQSAVSQGLLPAEFKKYQKLEDLVDDNKIIQNFQYNQTDLESAIISGHEVMVRGAYYAIRRDLYEKQFKRYLELTKSGPIDITPDTRREKASLNDKVSKMLGQEPSEFENGDIVKHDYEQIFGEVVNNFYTNDFLQVKNFDGELVLVKKSNVKKINVNDVEKFQPNDKVTFNTKNTMFSYLHNLRGRVVKVDGMGATVKTGPYNDTVLIPVFFLTRIEQYDTANPEKGDTVKITDGDYAGMYGKITYVGSYKDLEVEIEDNFTANINKGDYEVVDPATVPVNTATNTLPDGTYVQIKDDNGPLGGMVGTVQKSGSIMSTVLIFGNSNIYDPKKILTKRLVEISKDEYESKILSFNLEVVVVSGKHRGKTGKITYFYSNGTIEITTDDNAYIEVKAKDLVRKDKYTGKTPKNNDTENDKKANEPIKSDDDDLVDLNDLDWEPLDEPISPKSEPNKKAASDVDALTFKVGDDANATNPKAVKKRWTIYKINPDSITLQNKDTLETMTVSMDRFYKANPDYAPKSNKKTKEIVDKAISDGYVTYNTISEMLGENPSYEQVEGVISMFNEMGVKVVEDPGMIDPNQTAAEKKEQILDPDNKTDLLALLKEPNIKSIVRSAINEKFISEVNQLTLALLADEKYYTLIIPFLELKGVKLK